MSQTICTACGRVAREESPGFIDDLGFIQTTEWVWSVRHVREATLMSRFCEVRAVMAADPRLRIEPKVTAILAADPCSNVVLALLGNTHAPVAGAVNRFDTTNFEIRRAMWSRPGLLSLAQRAALAIEFGTPGSEIQRRTGTR